MRRLITNLYLLLFFATPLLFTSTTSELFEFPKMLFVYGLTIAIVSLHLINHFWHGVPLFRRTPLTIPLVIFFIFQVASTYLSVDPHTSIFGFYGRFNGGLLSLISYLLLYFVLVNYVDRKLIDQIIKTALASGFLVATYGILEHFGIDKSQWVQDVQSRVFSTLGQPNWLAAYLAILLPFAVYRFFNHLNNRKFLFSTLDFGLSTLFYLCLLFTKSKSGIIAADVAIIIQLFVLFIHHKSSAIHRKFLILIAAVLVLLSLTVANPLKDYLSPSPSSEISNPRSDILITPSGDIRKIVWQGAIDLWKKFPYFGTGVETFGYSYYWTRPASHNLTSEWDFLYNKAHNEYLNYLATTGTFGIITYLAVIIAILFLIINHRSSDDDNLWLAVLAAFISILITNAVGFSVVITSLYFYLLPALSKPIKSDPLALKTPALNRFFCLPLAGVGLMGTIFVLGYFQADSAYNQSQKYTAAKHYAAAYASAQSSVDLFASEPAYLNNLALTAAQLALVDAASDQTNEVASLTKIAVASAQKAATISPADVNGYKLQSQIYYYLSSLDSNYYIQAITSMVKATKLAPTDAKSFYILGEYWQNISKDDEAITNYQQALTLKPNYDYAAFALGQLYFYQKKYPEAKKYLDLTLKIAPTNTDAQKLLEQIK